jgi:hypothetical protein
MDKPKLKIRIMFFLSFLYLARQQIKMAVILVSDIIIEIVHIQRTHFYFPGVDIIQAAA